MLEGRMFRTAEIAQALREKDDELEKYLHPLMETIRRYRDTILFIWEQSARGRRAVSLDNLKRIHRRLTPQERDRPGQYRLTSPVHRDYYQAICEADKIPLNLKRVFDLISTECDDACDPVQFAAIVHHRLMHAYPFRRNPGTTIRLFTNLLLLSRGYPPAIIPSNKRDAYYRALNHPEPWNLGHVFAECVAHLMERSGTPLRLLAGNA